MKDQQLFNKSIGIRYGLVALLLLVLSPSSFAQSASQPINLQTVLELGGANNLTIQEYEQKQRLALANLAKAKEWWAPDLYAGMSMHQLWGNAMNGNGEFFVNVDRQNFWGGLGLNASWDFGQGTFLVDAADLQAKALSFDTEAEKNRALLEIVETYYDFLSSQLYYQAYAELAAQADTIAQQIAIQVEAGLRFESELLLAQSHHYHLKVKMLETKVDFKRESAALTRMLHIDPNTTLIAAELALAPIDLGLDVEDISFDACYEARPEVKSIQLKEASLLMQRKTTTSGLYMPELRVGAYSSLFGDVFNPINPTSEVNVSLLWKIPTGRLIHSGTLQQYDAALDLQEIGLAKVKAAINEEVLRAREQVSISEEQMVLSLEGSRLAEKALKQSVQRQNMGTVRPFEILQAQEVFITSKLDYLKAVAAYNKAQYALKVALGTSL